MATKFQIKRTSVSGRSPNTTNQANSGYIAAGELAVNLTDEKLYSSNGTVAFEVGANLTNLAVTNNITANQIVLTNPLIEKYSPTVTYIVTVDHKTSAHRYYSVGSTHGYVVDGLESPYLSFLPGKTYRFDQSDASNATHPLRFYVDADKTKQFTDGVTTSGTAGSSGAYVEIAVSANTPSTLHYQCTAHAKMGNQIQVEGSESFNSMLVTGNAVVNVIVANGATGTAGKFLTSNSLGGVYWANSPGITVELTNSTSNVTTLTTVNTLQFDENSGFNIVNVATGTAKVEINSTFKYWQVNGVTKLTATGLDTVNFIPIDNITINANGSDTPQSITFGVTLTPTFTNATFGNSTVNTVVNSSAIAVTKIFANGVVGTAGKVLTSNGTGGIYWDNATTGGGGGDLTIISDTFNGNGSNTIFTLSVVTTTDKTFVYLNGVLQTPTTDYSVANTTLTFVTAPPSDNAIEVRTFDIPSVADLTVTSDNFTGNGSNTQFTLTTSLSSDQTSLVFLNGVAQVPTTDYSISGSTLTFTAAPANGTNIQVTSFTAEDISTTTYTGNGSNTEFTLGTTSTTSKTVVTLNGVTQTPVTDYSVSGATLVFAVAPANNDKIVARSIPSTASSTAGGNTHIQYNKSGSLGGSAGFTFNETTNNVTIANTLTVPNLRINASNPPANSTSTGATGTIAWDSGYIYVAVGTNTWKKIAISETGAAGGGGSGLVRDSFTGNGSNVNFTLSKEPANEAQTLVFVDRVLQRDADYSLSGTTLTFASAPDNSAEIDVYISDPATTEAAGANTNIIFNDSNFANGSAAFTFNKATNTVALSNTLTVGSNLTINTSAIFIGNSTVNTTIIAGNVDLQGTQLRVGNVVVNGNQLTLGNVTITDTQITVGNSTVNTVLGSTGSLSGNGSQLTSVNAIALQGNSVNDILLAANTAANTLASAAFSNAATRADNAYSNATTYASNADNISSGTLNTARLPATVNVQTAINVGANVNINTSTIFIGNSTVNTTIAAGNINLQGTQLTVGNVTVTGDSYTIGNSTVNTTISGGSITINGVNVNTAITSNAATAYSNATSYADTKAGQAFTNAASRADSAYSNAVAYAASNTYVNTTFLPFTGGTLTGNLTVNATANIVSNLSANNVTFRGDVQIDGNLTVSGTSVVINATSLAVEDNMIYLNNGSQVSHPDLGFAGNYNDGSYKHAGFFRDATDGVWKLFDGYTPEPDASAYIDTSNASFRIADFTANVITANSFSGNGSSITSVNAATVGGNTASTLRSYSDTVAATAYSNAINYSGNAALAYSNATSFASNADNISSGTLNTARLPATVNVATLLNVGANSFVNTSAHFVGNGTVNSILTSTTLNVGGTLSFDGNNLSLAGAATPRLRANMSGTASSRFVIQNSTTDGNSRYYVIPNGTGTIAAVSFFNNSDISTNYSTLDIGTIASIDNRFTSANTGTGTLLPFTFYMNSSEIVRFAANGNVGIGNTAPADKLIVAGTLRSTGNVTVADSYVFVGQDVRSNGQIRATGWYNTPSSSRDGPAIEIGVSGSSGYILSYDRDASVYKQMTFGANSFNFQTQGTQIGTYISNSSATHAFFAANGNVGIGTTSPAGMLDVSSSATLNNTYFRVTSNTTSSYIQHYFYANTAFIRMGVTAPAYTGWGGDSWIYASRGLVLSANDGSGGVATYFAANGNVGVGTMSPVYKLDVAGGSRFSSTSNSTSLHIQADHVSGHACLKIQGVTANTATIGFFDTAGARKGLVYFDTDVMYLAGEGVGRIELSGTANLHIAANVVGFTGSTAYLRSDNEFNFLNRTSGNAQNARFGGIQVSDNYSGTIPANTVIFGNDAAVLIQRLGSNFIIAQNADSGSVMAIGGAGALQLLMDTNNNETGQKISFQKNATYNGTEVGYINEDGNLYINGTLTESSSIILKENITPITNALDLISQINGVVYDRKDGSAKNRAGLIAEQVEEILPDIVQRDSYGSPAGIQYTNLIAYLVESIKELKAEIDILKSK